MGAEAEETPKGRTTLFAHVGALTCVCGADVCLQALLARKRLRAEGARQAWLRAHVEGEFMLASIGVVEEDPRAVGAVVACSVWVTLKPVECQSVCALMLAVAD